MTYNPNEDKDYPKVPMKGVKMIIGITCTGFCLAIKGTKSHENYWNNRFEGEVKDWVSGKGLPKLNGVYELTMDYTPLPDEAIEKGHREYKLVSVKKIV